jgi:hypothetical protein
MHLGTWLLRDGVLNLGQLEEALRAQIRRGGRLGSNLVELQLLDLDTLGGYLARSWGVPHATQGMFEAIEPAVAQRFGAELAERCCAVPLGPQPDDPAMLAVALRDPLDEDLLAQLAGTLGQPVAPYGAPELRIYFYLERLFGVQRPERPLAGAQPPLPGARAAEARRESSGDGPALPPLRLEPRRQRRTSPPPPIASASRPPPCSFAQACAAVDSAHSRDEIAGALLDYAVERTAVALLFVVRDGRAIGWRGLLGGRHASATDIGDLNLPLAAASVLQWAHDEARIYHGGPLSPDHPVERRLWEVAGAPEPPCDMVVVPVLVKDRVVNLIYAHGQPGAIDPRLTGELGELALRTSAAYVRLIRAAKEAGDSSPPRRSS